MPRTRIAATAARSQFAEILNEVAYKGERVELERHGKSIAAVVPIEDLQLLEQLEDKMDLDAARKALAEKGERISWKELKQELGI